jgi:hypothetical protein
MNSILRVDPLEILTARRRDGALAQLTRGRSTRVNSIA